ncbi:MAG TPA: acetate--CoA ligase family protein [Acidimicrobiales bacterium]|nr:acetate--CoA ligase family protein [Acidimicrobiales bacterium]
MYGLNSTSAAVASSRLDDDLQDRLNAIGPVLDAFLHPRSIAVVGASAEPNTLGGLLFANLVGSGFRGVALPVNKRHAEVQGVAAYPDLVSCPTVPDCVFVCVPAPAVPAVVAQAGDLGSKAVCVISAGYAETGSVGAGLQASLVETATAHGVRIVGPNCTGVLSGRGDWRFNVTFGRTVPRPGNTCMLSQSGAFGLGMLEMMQARNLGIGGFVSVGNAADVAVTDLLLYWGSDPLTKLILLYLESVPEPGSFIRAARQIGAEVPIVVLKAGRTKAGRRGAASHTAALSSGDAAVDAALRQAGVVRPETFEEMLDLAVMLGSEQRFLGRRVAIVTNGGGSGVLAADACESNGLVVPALSPPTVAALRSLLPPEASVANPVDMIASATEHHYGQVVRALGASSEVDAIVVVFNVPVLTTTSAVAAELVAARREIPEAVALVAVFLNSAGPPPVLRDAGIASFMFPEDAARALGRGVAWQSRRARTCAEVRSSARSRPVVDRTLPMLSAARQRARDGWLTTADAEALLSAYHIALPGSCIVRSPEEAGAAQERLGRPVAVKIAAGAHKSDLGGVRLGVCTPEAAADAVVSIRAALGRAGMAELANEILVQEQVGGGQEMIVGFNRDPLLGPVVMVGLGGRSVELLGDVALRVAPLSDQDVEEMVQSLKSYPLLVGYRGAPRLDYKALCRVVTTVSDIAMSHPEVTEMDINPLFVMQKGAVAADVRARLNS